MANEKSTKLMTPRFRVSFPDVFKPRAMQVGQTEKYAITMLFNMAEINKDPKQKALFDAMVAEAQRAVKEKWADKRPAGLRNPFRDGKEKAHLEGYGDGVIFVKASTTTKPGLIDGAKQDIISPDEFYAGCYARATVNVYAYDKAGNKGVSFGLQNIQKLADGEPFSGRTSAEEDFDATEAPSEEQAPAAAGNAASLFD